MLGAKTKKRERIVALDLIRGLFLLVIICDHIAWTPSLLLQFATSNTGSFASAAEGFFAISGILVGYIYGPRFLTNTWNVTRKIWRRAGLLYILAVGFTLFYSFWSMNLATPYSRLAWIDQPISHLIFNTITLQHTYGLTDFLARYALFMLLVPVALWFITKRKAWLVAVGSLLTWHVFHERDLLSPYASWQIIFMIAVIIGFYLPVIEVWLKKRTILRRSVASAAIASYVFVVLWSILPGLITYLFSSILSDANIQSLTSIELTRQIFIVDYFDKDTMALGRLAIGCLWFAGLYILFRRYETTINRFTHGTLQKLGQYSLLVYCLQAFFIFLMDITITIPLWTNILINTIVNCILVIIIYLVVFYYDRYKKNKASQVSV